MQLNNYYSLKYLHWISEDINQQGSVITFMFLQYFKQVR